MASEQSSAHLHLTDDQIVEAYVLGVEQPHLSACGGCLARFNELAGLLGPIRDESLRDADAVFTGERLHHQRDRVLRRLQRQGLPAELLRFPTRTHHPTGRRVIGPARRWVAAAAAAGLAAGVFLGFAMDHRAAPGGSVNQPLQRQVSSTTQDEEMLSQIEDALNGPRRILELQAIDLMTTPAELQEASFDIR